MKFHTPVLLHEAIELLDVRENKWYIDATLGGGGHTGEILKRGGKVLSLDVDQEAIDHVQNELRIKNEELRIGDRLKIAKGNFRDIDSIARKEELDRVSGILFDLGVSSHQFDDITRGFSFQGDAELDMRMDRDLQVKASDLLNALGKKELYELFNTLGEERNSFAISDYIVRARRIKPITTTSELVEIIEKASRQKRSEGVHIATRVFQALRIAVNDELHAISEALPKAFELLEKEGRMVVISFHSLEDRIVKNQFRKWEEEGKGKVLTDKPMVASEDEVSINKRSRSAKLRAFIKNE